MVGSHVRVSRGAAALAVTVCLSAALVGCAQQEADPLEVTNTATINDITDNTDTGYYTVDSAVLDTTSFGTELTLGFTILNSNGIKFSPVSTITFSDGTELTCEADDLRRVPSLVDTTDSWDFACDADEFPAKPPGEQAGNEDGEEEQTSRVHPGGAVLEERRTGDGRHHCADEEGRAEDV